MSGLSLTINPLTSSPQPAAQTTETNNYSASGTFWGEDGFTFGDVLDIINPLKQLPGISTLYREATGETISSGARLAGGALFGGPIGFVVALLNEITASATGNDLGGHAYAALAGEDNPSTQVADAGLYEGTYLPSNRLSALNSYVQAQSLLA